MPAAPELLGVLRLVGGIEVLREVEAHQEGDACRDVRVAGEVGIDLEGVAEQGGEVLETGVQERIPEHPVTEVHGEVIGQDELLHQAVHDPEHGDTEPPAAQVVGLVQLREELRGPDDRAGHKLREEGQEEAEIQEIMDGFHLLPLHVHHVADGLEGEEGDAHGKDDGIDPEELCPGDQVPQFPEDVPHLDGDSEEVADEVRQEIRVLEIRQDAQVHHHGKHHPEGLPARPRPVQPPGCEKVVGDDEKQQHQEHPARLVVEEQADEEQIRVSQERLGVDEREPGEHQREERPEIELGEQQRVCAVKGEESPQQVPYDIHGGHRPMRSA